MSKGRGVATYKKRGEGMGMSGMGKPWALKTKLYDVTPDENHEVAESRTGPPRWVQSDKFRKDVRGFIREKKPHIYLKPQSLLLHEY